MPVGTAVRRTAPPCNCEVCGVCESSTCRTHGAPSTRHAPAPPPQVGVDGGDNDSEGPHVRKPPETDLLANYVSRLVNEIDNARWKVGCGLGGVGAWGWGSWWRLWAGPGAGGV